MIKKAFFRSGLSGGLRKVEIHDAHGSFQDPRDFLKREGYVVIRKVATSNECEAVVDVLKQIPSTCKKSGFAEFYHDASLAAIRQKPEIYEVFANILQSRELWVVFDRCIHYAKDEKEEALPLHVDQNPDLESNPFAYLQGMIALRDMNEHTGTLIVLPRSHREHFQDYKAWSKGSHYVEYDEAASKKLHGFKALRLAQGDMCIWYSATTHSRLLRTGSSQQPRFAMLISYIHASDGAELRKMRLDCFRSAQGRNNHAAGLRATSSPRPLPWPRQEEETLTALGQHLYGLTVYTCGADCGALFLAFGMFVGLFVLLLAMVNRGW